jgi:hypothetical protein
MKALLAFALVLFSASSFAWTEVECEKRAEPRLYLQIDEPMPRNSSFRWANVQIENQNFTYSLNFTQRVGFNRIRYWGGGMELEVDLWPDQRPMWGRTYRAEFSSSAGSWRKIPVTCRFPNI